ncbi:hypothetical protein J2Z40_001587 [Cytobacillus eiseniae]|uniref:Uncharacterized protein n=1 Tax=Cytobacillus eiseniae TaxID=762947 RepID=A0ABS4RDQ0_9BACI|nr:hypothetical protein [Cytobacillus eiseniae]MBP2241027.1 hypothetical protein [Cytobacillus eiseniae]
MKNKVDVVVTSEMVAQYHELNGKKKEIEAQLNELKNNFNHYFDRLVGKNIKGEKILGDFKLQRQIRITEKYEDEATVNRLEGLNLQELIIKKPDEEKIKSALNLGLLKEEDLKDCKKISYSQAIYVKSNE